MRLLQTVVECRPVGAFVLYPRSFQRLTPLAIIIRPFGAYFAGVSRTFAAVSFAFDVAAGVLLSIFM